MNQKQTLQDVCEEARYKWVHCATTEPTLSIACWKIKMAATTKRKKMSKNKKQTWRKHTDIKEVEEHLEEARREERTGLVYLCSSLQKRLKTLK